MEIGNNNRFYVVEFFDPPYKGFDQYVCVPGSWVQMHDESKELVVTKYPVEKSLKTEQRVKEGDASLIDWSFYTANFKYRTDSYEEAKKYIETLENRVVMERNSPELMSEDGDEDFSSSTRMNESQIASFNDNVEPASEQPPLTNFETKIQKKFANSTNKLTNRTPTLSKSLNDKQLLSISSNETSNNVDRSEINDNPEGKTRNESVVNDNAPKSANESLDSTIVRKPIFGTDSSDLINEINRTTLSAQSTPINNKFAARDYNSTATTSKDTVTLEDEEQEEEEVEEEEEEEEEEEVEDEEEREKERQVATKKQVETGVLKRKKVVSDERENDDDNQNFYKKKRSSIRFPLPPEFDESDPKWTLKYRQPSSEYVELIEGSGIFVNAAKLIKHERSTTDAKELARLLLSEVFTENALRTCVFPGRKYNANNDDGSNPKPRLDESAIAVLLKYVEGYAQTHDWPKVSKNDIRTTIRKKLEGKKRTRK